MKDEHDNSTVDFCPVVHDELCAFEQPHHVPQWRGAVAKNAKKKAKKPVKRTFPPMPRIDGQCDDEPPKCAERKPGHVFGMQYYGHFVPVSYVAKDWGVSSRRIRALLSAGRLMGQIQPNGYWEVRYPYFISEGTRGPVLKRQQRQPDKPKKPVLMAV